MPIITLPSLSGLSLEDELGPELLAPARAELEMLQKEKENWEREKERLEKERENARSGKEAIERYVCAEDILSNLTSSFPPLAFTTTFFH